MMTITRALPRPFRFAAGFLTCSASVIPITWSQSALERHVVVGRVQISAVIQPLKLAEPNPITIQSNGQEITSVSARWFYDTGSILSPGDEDTVVLPVSADSNGGASVNVTPLKAGKARLMLFVSFADGGFERKTIDLQVAPSARKPKSLVITPGGGDNRWSYPVISLDLSDAHKTRYVDPYAVYENVSNPISLNASDVSFRVIASTGPGAAAKIDPSTGIVTALHVGQALLETKFKGLATLTCIDVMKDVRGTSRSRCKELLPPGRSLPPDPLDLGGPPPVAVKPPPRVNTNPQ